MTRTPPTNQPAGEKETAGGGLSVVKESSGEVSGEVKSDNVKGEPGETGEDVADGEQPFSASGDGDAAKVRCRQMQESSVQFILNHTHIHTSLTHSLIHSLTHSLTDSLTHSFTYMYIGTKSTHTLNRSPSYTIPHSLTYTLTHVLLYTYSNYSHLSLMTE